MRFFPMLLSVTVVSLAACGKATVSSTQDSNGSTSAENFSTDFGGDLDINVFQKKLDLATQLFNSAQKDSFLSNDTTVRTRQFINPDANKHIMILHGVCEGAHNYMEMIYDLYKHGYSVHIFSYTGMGESGRTVTDTQLVTIDKFQTYYDDAEHFLSKFVMPQVKPNQKLFLFSHSTGGLVSAHLLARQPKAFAAAALSSPLFSVNTGATPKWIAKAAVASLALVNPNGYAPGFGPKVIEDLTFETNKGTQSYPRWLAYNNLIHVRSDVFTSGPSSRWVNEAFSETEPKKIAELAKQQKTPIKIYEATKDQFVDIGANKIFAEIAKDVQIFTVKGASHEIYREKDTFRNQMMNDIESFFRQH